MASADKLLKIVYHFKCLGVKKGVKVVIGHFRIEFTSTPLSADHNSQPSVPMKSETTASNI